MKVEIKFSIIALILLLGGCNNPKASQELYYQGQYRVIEIDGCEYIQSMVYSGYNLCHKGNCKYCKNEK